jgi:histidine triad (HIT) family protein
MNIENMEMNKMNDCIFCKIIKGELPSKTVYEDDTIKVIMNINPITDGHLLILPKEHYENILDIQEEIIAHSIKILREKLYPLLKEKLNCEGFTICENNFLGQDIKHFHIHVIPRYQNDKVDFNYNSELLSDIDDVFTKLENK